MIALCVFEFLTIVMIFYLLVSKFVKVDKGNYKGVGSYPPLPPPASPKYGYKNLLWLCMDWGDSKQLFGDIVYIFCRIGILSSWRSVCPGKREVSCLNERNLWKQ